MKAHLAINVKNIEQSIEFYRKLFGIGPSKVRAGYAKFDVQNPPLNLRSGKKLGLTPTLSLLYKLLCTAKSKALATLARGL